MSLVKEERCGVRDIQFPKLVMTKRMNSHEKGIWRTPDEEQLSCLKRCKHVDKSQYMQCTWNRKWNKPLKCFAMTNHSSGSKRENFVMERYLWITACVKKILFAVFVVRTCIKLNSFKKCYTKRWLMNSFQRFDGWPCMSDILSYILL